MNKNDLRLKDLISNSVSLKQKMQTLPGCGAVMFNRVCQRLSLPLTSLRILTDSYR
jgi:hypothetical protein